MVSHPHQMSESESALTTAIIVVVPLYETVVDLSVLLVLTVGLVELVEFPLVGL